MTSEPAIRTQNLTRRFKDVVAVNDLTMKVLPGEIFGLVGPDGAGKTTTIRLLASILDTSGGSASVAGFDIVHQPEPIKRRIGYMAQRFNLYADLSVWENLCFFADIFGVTGEERARRIDRLLKFSRLDEFQDRRAAHLSGGMQKKLALACTLIHTPEIIFLDEPTTGVDPVSRREFWDILTDLHLQGITLVVSTPYMDEAERCSRVGLMYRGKLVICDTPENIKNMTQGELVALWPDDMRAAYQVLNQLDCLIEIQTYGDQLRIFCLDAQKAIEQIQPALAAGGIRIKEIRMARPRMEEAFISLIGQQMKEQQEDKDEILS